MKFKTIFLLFNIIVFFSFLFIILMPLIMLGGDYIQVFWKSNWPLALVFLIFVGLLDGYFVINWKLFSFLENENWPALISWLEDQIYVKKRWSKKNVYLLINTSLTISNPDKIRRLEEEIRTGKETLFPYFGLFLGIPHLIANEMKEASEYYQELSGLEKLNHKDWVAWCACFAGLSGENRKEALSLLTPYLETLPSKDPVYSAAALYLLSCAEPELNEDEKEKLSEKRTLLRNSLRSDENWNRKIERYRDRNVIVLLFASILQNAWEWVKGDGDEK